MQVRSREEIELALMATTYGSESQNIPRQTQEGFAQARAFLYWVLGGEDESITDMIGSFDIMINQLPAEDAKLLRKYFVETAAPA